MRIRQNLGSISSAIGKNNFQPSPKAQVGKVYGVVTTENTPTQAMFEKVGGFNGIGTIFYLDYDQAKNTVGNIGEEFLNGCKTAKPLYSQYQYFPILGELVLLEDLPSPTSQVTTGANQNQKYYISTINLWNNPQQNAQPVTNNASLGVTFTENPNIRSLLSFEGDHIIQGRQGNAIRFGTTTKLFSKLNEWSSIGKDDDPITILSNGFSYDPNERFHVEKINEDKSSIYLTSAQKIPLKTSKTGNLNNLTNPLNPPDYFSAQVIINSDRVILNSKKDEVMIFAQTNIELNTQNIINLNADKRVHLNSPSIYLGPYDPNNLLQPVLLGNETINLFLHFQQSLVDLAEVLSSMIGVSEGAPMININAAGKELSDDMKVVSDLIAKITSKKVFTA
jgi:hypothetical protein